MEDDALKCHPIHNSGIFLLAPKIELSEAILVLISSCVAVLLPKFIISMCAANRIIPVIFEY